MYYVTVNSYVTDQCYNSYLAWQHIQDLCVTAYTRSVCDSLYKICVWQPIQDLCVTAYTRSVCDSLYKICVTAETFDYDDLMVQQRFWTVNLFVQWILTKHVTVRIYKNIKTCKVGYFLYNTIVDVHFFVSGYLYKF